MYLMYYCSGGSVLNQKVLNYRTSSVTNCITANYTNYCITSLPYCISTIAIHMIPITR